jgi:hypothetical protein
VPGCWLRRELPFAGYPGHHPPRSGRPCLFPPHGESTRFACSRHCESIFHREALPPVCYPHYTELRIRVLEEQLRLMRIERYGADNEKLSQAQMELFALEPVVSEVLVQAESECTPVRGSTNRSCKHPGRQELPANLPRVEQVLPQELGPRVFVWWWRRWYR